MKIEDGWCFVGAELGNSQMPAGRNRNTPAEGGNSFGRQGVVGYESFGGHEGGAVSADRGKAVHYILVRSFART